MAGQRGRLIDRLLHRRSLRHWAAVEARVAVLGIGALKGVRGRARALGQVLDRVLRRVDLRRWL